MDGRYDIVAFGNGGWECIGRINSEPDVPVQILHDHAQLFVEGLEADNRPVKYTGVYDPDSEPFVVEWGEWQGEIPVEDAGWPEDLI